MSIIETRSLSRRYGRTEAVHDLTLSVPEGSIFAFVGPNGAGKTTTIKTLMNILEPSGGTATVLGVDSRRLGPPQFRQIGYVSENQELPGWMTLRELLDYCAPFYPTWDPAFAEDLRRRLDLPLDRKLRAFSRGTRMKAALLSSLAYRPTLLVLDEPFAGLDALVRDEFIQGILELADQSRWSIFISSHDIDEVERLADWIGVINDGCLYLAEPVSSLVGRFRRIEATFDDAAGAEAAAAGLKGQAGPPSRSAPARSRQSPPATTRRAEAESLPRGEEWLAPEAKGHTLQVIDARAGEPGGEQRVREVLRGASRVEVSPMPLKAIFMALARTFRSSTRTEDGR
jgi:ABC-2 type transport system ATP-binding protein